MKMYAILKFIFIYIHICFKFPRVECICGFVQTFCGQRNIVYIFTKPRFCNCLYLKQAFTFLRGKWSKQRNKFQNVKQLKNLFLLLRYERLRSTAEQQFCARGRLDDCWHFHIIPTCHSFLGKCSYCKIENVCGSKVLRQVL